MTADNREPHRWPKWPNFVGRRSGPGTQKKEQPAGLLSLSRAGDRSITAVLSKGEKDDIRRLLVEHARARKPARWRPLAGFREFALLGILVLVTAGSVLHARSDEWTGEPPPRYAQPPESCTVGWQPECYDDMDGFC